MYFKQNCDGEFCIIGPPENKLAEEEPTKTYKYF